MLQLALLVTISSHSAHVTAQGYDIYRSHFHQLKVEQLTADNGLSQGMVTSLVFDKTGYMWIGTKDGLNRYDGNSFKVYRHNPDDTNSMQKNYIERINIDRKNRIWITYESGGLDLFDRSNETFIHISSKTSNAPWGFLCETDKGDILANSVNGVYKIDAHRKSASDDYKITVTDHSTVYPFSMGVFRYNIYPYATTYYTTDGSIVVNNRRHNQKKSLLDYAPVYIFSKKAIENREAPILKHVDSGSCFLSGDWSGKIGKRIYYYDNAGSFQILDSEQGVFKKVASVNNIGSEIIPFADNDNNIWFFDSASENIMRIRKPDNSIDTFQLEWPNIVGHLNRAVFDRNGNMWVPSGGFGFYKIKPKSARFHKLNLPNEGRGYSLRISVAGNSRFFDGEINNSWYKIPKDLNYRVGYEKINGLMYDRSRSLTMQDISYEGPIRLVTVNKDKQIEFKSISDSNYKDSGYLYMYRSSFLDNHNKIWTGITVQKYGLNDHDEFLACINNYKISERYAFPEIQGPLRGGYHFITDMFQQPDDKMWFATASGVYSFNPETTDWKHWVNIPGDTNSLSSNATISIAPDPHEPKRYLWVGTDGAGLNRLDVTTGKCRRFTVEDGLPNNVIYNILADEHNNLWMSTNKGLCLFYTKTFEIRNFTIKDGVPANEFNKYAGCMDTSGRMYFNYTDAYSSSIYFDPKDFYNDTFSSTTVINELKLFNKEVDYQHHASDRNDMYQLPAAVEFCEELVFEHDQAMITLSYDVLDLTNPEDNVYKYKLEGFNDDWIYAGTQREATFTNLSPGTYTFKVVGRNSNYVWSKAPATMQITILAPWWGTWWFRLCTLFAVAGILYGLYRYRTSQLLRVERMRNDIAQDLHDEIGSTLSSISLYTTVMQKTSEGLSKKSGLLLNKIEKNTSEMMEAMNDIVWATKADNDSLEQVIDRMRAFAASTTEAKGIKLEFNVERKAERIKVSMHQRKNIYMMFKEAVNNAIKHSDCDKIIVSVISTTKKLQISIQDNGKGFDVKEVHNNGNSLSGNGLDGMERRAQQIGAICSINSTRGIGTVISITLALK